MGIDSDRVLFCMWRFIRLFINTCYVVCVEKHPFVSCTLLITFLIYISFNLLLHHLPFLVLVALLLRLFWSSERRQADHRQVKETEKSDSSLEHETSVKAVGEATREIPSFRRQKSRRTYFSKNNIIQENDTKPPVVPESKRAKGLHGDRREQDERLGFARPNYFSSEDDSEETNVKAFEWTEEDQRNLDNLGVSEIERNRRLESLIAKRMARNQDRPPITTTTTVDPPRGTRKISPRKPISVPRTIGGDGSEKVPGSAPSVLAAGKNPFDIPYDPTEEKPDLTAADSLFDHGEFLAGNCQNESGGPNPTYCRHESFSYGGLLGGQFESERDRREAKLGAFFGAGKSGLARISGNDRLMEQLLGNTKSHMDNTPSMVESETAGTERPTQTLDSETSLDSEISKLDRETETTNDRTVSEQDALNDMESANNIDTMAEADTEQSIVEDSETTSSSSLDVPIANRSMEAIASLESMQGYSHEDSSMIPTSIHYSNDKNTDTESVDDRFFFGDKLSTHTPSYSLASDLHVEVSEIDSPPLTVGNITPNDRDSLSFDDDETECSRLNLDIESLDDINQALERAENSRGSLDELADKNQETTMTSLAERLSSHPFFESVYGTREETLFRPDDSVGENTVDDTGDLGTNSMDDMKGQEDNEHGDILISEETTKPSDSDSEGNPQNCHQPQSPSDSSTQQPIVVNTDTNVAKNNNHESLVEEVVVNSSSPSSPLSTPVRLIPVHKVFSSNLEAKSDAQPPGHASSISPADFSAQCSNSSDFEPLQM